jgi:hypothetical protein
MEQALAGASDVEQAAAQSSGDGREGEGRGVERAVLGVALVKALDLSDQATEKAQHLTRRSRRKYRRIATKEARKLERRIAAAAQRLEIAMPVEKRRRRGRRVVLFAVIVGSGISVYLAWRSRQKHGEGEAPEAGPTPDAADAALDDDGRERSTTDIASF